MRMVDRVHRNPAVMRTLTQPPRTTRFADGDVLVVDIADLPNRRHAVLRNFAGFAGRQFHQGVFAFFRHQLRLPTRRAHHLRALSRAKLQVMNRRARWNIFQRQRVPNQNVGIGTANDLLANLQPFRLQNVALLAVRIRQQRNARRTVGIVLDADDGCRNAGLIALKVDTAQLALVPTADEAHGGVARIAAAAGAVLFLKQRLMRMPGRDVVIDQRLAIAQRLRRRSVSLDCHKKLSAFRRTSHVASRTLLRTTHDERRTTVTNSARTPASSRRISTSRTLFSNPDGSRQTSPAAAPCPDSSLCARKRLSL